MTGLLELTVPRKRNVKELTVSLAALGALGSGSSASATFFDERYGAFNIAGLARLSPIVGSYTLAGRVVEQNLKPDRSLQLLALQDADADDNAAADAEEPDDVDTANAETLPKSDDLADTVGPLGHGDLVRARFNDGVYGDFTVTGVSVWSTVGGTLLVGGWILSQLGVPALRLRHVETVAKAGGHVHPVPMQITSLAEDAALLSET